MEMCVFVYGLRKRLRKSYSGEKYRFHYEKWCRLAEKPATFYRAQYQEPETGDNKKQDNKLSLKHA